MALLDKDQVKAEIKRRYAEYSAKARTDDTAYYAGMADAIDLFEQYIDTLLEQPVTDCHDFEQGLDSEIFFWQKAHANEDTAQVIAMTARHFAEWGAIHLNARKEE